MITNLLRIVNRLAASCELHAGLTDAACFINLQQVCEHQVAASLMMFTDLMKSTGLIQLVGKLHQAGKIYNLHQVCGVFGCVQHDAASSNNMLVDRSVATCQVR